MKRRALWGMAGVGLVIAAAALVFAYRPYGAPEPVASAPVTPELIERGRYVAVAADCVACHTTAGGQPYAGGRAFHLPFGTIYSPNITPDPQTGIGAWTNADFVRALHQGVGRRGSDYYPAFPYTSYARMTEQDAVALRAYLSTLSPVRARPPRSRLVFPFNQRPLMRFWKLLFLHAKPFQPDPGQNAQWNRGVYLVTALGHCGECHTPRNLLYAVNQRQALSGETMQGWTAWNITSDPRHGLGARSSEAIMEYLQYGYAPGMGVAGGPMKEAVDFSLSRLTHEDLSAIAAYLKSTPAKSRGPLVGVAPAGLVQASAEVPGPVEPNTGAGRRLFEGACASCHAWNGQGQETPMAGLAGLPSVNDPKAVNVVQAVLRGLSISAPQGHAFMPAFAAAYSDAEVAAVSNYVVGRFGGHTGHVSARQVAQARAQ